MLSLSQSVIQRHEHNSVNKVQNNYKLSTKILKNQKLFIERVQLRSTVTHKTRNNVTY